MDVQIQEVVPHCSRRTAMGRVVVKAPAVMGPLKHKTTGRFFMCCNRAFLTEESYKKHQAEKSEHGKPLDLNKIPKFREPLQPAMKAIHDPSNREFWIYRKKGIINKVLEVNEENSELDQSGDAGKEKPEKITVMDVDNSGRGKGWKRCEICNLTTTKLSRHVQICHSNGPYKCQYCPCTFFTKSSRAAHQKKMHRVRTVPLESIKQTIVSRAKKKLASTKFPKDILENVKQNRITKCPICEKECHKMYLCRGHILRVHQKKLYTCEHCGMGFSFLSNLHRHRNTAHTSEPKFFCEICKSGFSTSTSMHFHSVRVHSIVVPRSPKKLAQRNHLPTIQKRSNNSNASVNGNNDAPIPPSLKLQHPAPSATGTYQCHICNKELMTPQTWRGHMLIHQNLKPYKCKLCGISFRLLATRNQHVKTAHGNGAHKCPNCSCRYHTGNVLRRHLQKYHSTADSTTVNKKIKLSNENSVAGYRCNLCGKMFRNLSDFNDHKLAHSNVKKTQCNLCLQKFRAVFHLNIHKKQVHGNGTHCCPFCSCRYSISQGLFRHLTIRHGMMREEWDFGNKCIQPEAQKRIELESYESSTMEAKVTSSNDKTTVSNDVSANTDDRKVLMAADEKQMVECDLCHIKVTSRSLVAHRKNSHFHDGNFKCPHCSCRFRVLAGLSVHLALYHGNDGKLAAKKYLEESKLAKAKQNGLNSLPNPKNTAKDEQQKSTPTGVLSYMCTYCAQTFQNKQIYRKHVQLHQSAEGKFKCDLCHLRLGSRGALGTHKKTSHFHDGKFECSKCSCKFLSAHGLINHNKAHHGLGVGKLNNSKSATTVGSVLKKASVIKNKYTFNSKIGKNRLFRCSYCPKELTSNESLRIHLLLHSSTNGEKRFECDLCGFTFSTLVSVSIHKKRCHDHDGKMQCAKCSCKFLTKNGLINHETRNHGRISPRKQKNPNTLEQAMTEVTNQHNTEYVQENKNALDNVENSSSIRTVECDLCLLQIKVATKLRQHKEYCHFHDGSFQCSFCTCKFKTQKGLNQHTIKYHQKTCQSKQSESKKLLTAVNSASSLSKITRKSIKRTGVSRVVTARKVLKKSQRLKKQKHEPATCTLCKCTYTRKGGLQKHLKMAHSGGEYKCIYCSCSYHNQKSLKMHIKWHEFGRFPQLGRKYKRSLNEKLGNETIASSNVNSDKPSKKATNRRLGRFNLNFLKVRASKSIKRPTPKVAQNLKVSVEKKLVPSKKASNPVKPESLLASRKYKCDICGVTFTAKIYYSRHTKKAHVAGGIPCDSCPCTFENTWTLASHKRVYHSSVPYQKFKVKRGNSPLKQQSPKAPVKNKSSPMKQTNAIVDKTAKNDNLKNSKRKTSETVDPIDKAHAGKTTDRASKVRGNGVKSSTTAAIAQQQPEQQFQCSWCTKTLASEKLLSKHMLCHTRPERCSKCDMRFRTKEEVVKHLKTHHNNNGQFKCNVCSCRFLTDVGRNIHSKIHKETSTKSLHELNTNNYVIEHELQEEGDDSEPFLQIQSTYSQNVDYSEASEPIIQGILNTNHSSFVINGVGSRRVENGTSSAYFAGENELTDDTYEMSEPVVQPFESDDEIQIIEPSYTRELSTSVSTSNPSLKKQKNFSPKSRPMKCGICSVTCYGPENLQQHMRSHNEQESDNKQKHLAKATISREGQSFKCPKCGNEFKSQEELNSHLQKEHDESGLYRCAYCPCTMKTEDNLRTHFVKYHDMC